MTSNEMINFRKLAETLSVEELEKQSVQIKNDISKMILDSDLIMKAAIIDTILKEKRSN